VSDGEPILGPKETIYQPGDYSDLWEPLFPAHDYPMPFAESCLNLYLLTGKEIYREACWLWANQIHASLPARSGKGGYAEHYGRCIHFLLAYKEVFGEPLVYDLAIDLCDEAIEFLFAQDMFRGHPGEDRYDALDGVGFLLLALIRLHTDEEPEMMGLGW